MIEMIPEVKIIRVGHHFYNARWLLNLHGFGPVFFILLFILLLCASTVILTIISAGG